MFCVNVNIILDFPLTYKTASMIFQSECACLHQTANMAVVFFYNKKYLPKRESTHADVKSCPSNETKECSSMCNIYNSNRSKLLCYITCWQLFSYLLDRTFITSWSISYN